MKMKVWSVLAALGFAVVVGLAWQQSALAADEDMPAIRKQCESFVASWNKHDPKGMAAIFADDADMVDAAGHTQTGRAAIEKAFATDHGATGALRESKLAVKDEPVRLLTADVAISDATAEVSGALGPDGKKADPMTVVVTNVWKKTGANWYIVASRANIRQAAPSR